MKKNSIHPKKPRINIITSDFDLNIKNSLRNLIKINKSIDYFLNLSKIFPNQINSLPDEFYSFNEYETDSLNLKKNLNFKEFLEQKTKIFNFKSYLQHNISYPRKKFNYSNDAFKKKNLNKSDLKLNSKNSKLKDRKENIYIWNKDSRSRNSSNSKISSNRIS